MKGGAIELTDDRKLRLPFSLVKEHSYEEEEGDVKMSISKV